MKPVISIALCCLFAAPLAMAQDLRHLQPEPVEPPPPPTPATTPAPTPAPANTLLLAQLNGVAFLADRQQLAEPVLLNSEQLDVRALPLLQAPAFSHRLQPWLGQPLTRLDLQRLLAAVNAHYAAADRPFVRVSVPDQDISDGILRVLVIEGRLDEVTVRGNHWFSSGSYRQAVQLQPGDAILKSEIDAALDWITRSNPFRSAGVTALPGTSFGTTALRLDVRERKPLRVYAGANNTGTETTDRERLVIGANWGNALGRGHQLSGQITSSPDFHKSLGLSANYTAPLQTWRHLLHLNAAWSRINADVPANFDSAGESAQLLAAYEIPFHPAGALRHSLRIGADFKRSDNNLEFGGMPVTDNVTDVLQLALTWQGSLPDRYGHSALSTRLVYSPGSLNARNEDAAFEASRWGAAADYFYGRLDADRYTILPAGFGWQVSLALQQSSDNLLGSEQLALSGVYGVRGYEENALYADEGLLLRNELQLPGLSLLQPGLHSGGAEDHLLLLIFADYGRGNSVTRLSGEPARQRIAAVGLGAHYSLGQHLSASLEYGWQQKDLAGQGRDNRAHMSINVSF